MSCLLTKWIVTNISWNGLIRSSKTLHNKPKVISQLKLCGMLSFITTFLGSCSIFILPIAINDLLSPHHSVHSKNVVQIK